MSETRKPGPLTNPFQEVPMSETKPDRCPRCQSTERFARRIWQGGHPCTRDDYDPWHDEIVDTPPGPPLSCPTCSGEGDSCHDAFHSPDPLVEEVERRMYAVFNKRIGCVLDVAILAQSRQEAVSVAVAMLRERDGLNSVQHLFRLQDALPPESQVGCASGWNVAVSAVIGYVKRLQERIAELEKALDEAKQHQHGPWMD